MSIGASKPQGLSRARYLFRNRGLSLRMLDILLLDLNSEFFPSAVLDTGSCVFGKMKTSYAKSASDQYWTKVMLKPGG